MFIILIDFKLFECKFVSLYSSLISNTIFNSQVYDWTSWLEYEIWMERNAPDLFKDHQKYDHHQIEIDNKTHKIEMSYFCLLAFENMP